ncbi:hypothetical protein THASP1DRAFT_24617 [Thamnocephalis sphaerospora]|uniref:Uncharacterized protein n=1 Tax=Thamnocephalis sphaerospora TaxID=78915 RepID=A0A4P9XMN9_9FUNG|nr:hypothetical protein THASP1DRAFT_24617 [Thamnocephalis sphaerospora]|eukprot:RKP07184.1 hypothetical protein THASP1DRAFT_24617 [Thamnocephalis sphaerospora]
MSLRLPSPPSSKPRCRSRPSGDAVSAVEAAIAHDGSIHGAVEMDAAEAHEHDSAAKHDNDRWLEPHDLVMRSPLQHSIYDSLDSEPMDYFDLEELIEQASTGSSSCMPGLSATDDDDGDYDEYDEYDVYDRDDHDISLCEEEEDDTVDALVKLPEAPLSLDVHPSPLLSAPSAQTVATTPAGEVADAHSAPVAYRFDAQTGCMTPPPSPYVPIHLPSFVQQHPHVRQWMLENQFSYPQRYPVAMVPAHPQAAPAPGYAGDAWSTWNQPADLQTSSATHSSSSVWADEDLYLDVSDDDGDEPYSPSDDWLFGAYGVSGQRWVIEEAGSIAAASATLPAPIANNAIASMAM